MDANSNQLTSADSSPSPSPLWDVFLSFYGEDTRNNFTAHLYSALNQAAIWTYRDDPELEKGQEISSGLLKAIQDSKASIVVLSNNYARSAWCLNELVEILACKKTKGMVVFPIFYHVNPSDIRSQKGSFGEALETHKKLCSVDKIKKWRDALTEIALLSGYHLGKESNMNESDKIQQIVKYVAPQVSTKALHLKEHLVGIDSAVEEIYKKLNMHSNDARAIGICGMGGIGKTTIAKRFFNRYFDRFDSGCIAEGVKETLQGRNGLLALLNQLLAQLMRIKDFNVCDVESGIRKLNDIFSSRKVLIVLDDIDQSSDVELLIRRCNLFSPESRIVMTTRDAHLLRRLNVDIHIAKKLGENESLELFTYHAFGRTIPTKDFEELSKKFVNYAGGLPLALEVLGSSLRHTSMSCWQIKLEKLKEIPEIEINSILKTSYDELSDRTVKAIFLDIVFFFLGYDKDEAICVFDSCGFYPVIGIQILVDRCLLTFQDNKLKMHNLIRDMGKEVIRQESEEKGNSRRLWCQGNAFELFENQEATNKIEGLILDLTMWTKKHLSVKIFERMTNLRLLEIINAPHDFKVSFKNSFPELRYIRWHHCPWKQLPSSFRAQKLLFLDMQFSNMKTLWKGPMPLVNLKSINVSWSKCLTTTPNFSNVKMLEKLLLRCCGNLLEVHQSIGQLSNLSHLDFRKCRNLKRFPETIGRLEKLRQLDFGDCHSLKGCFKPIKQLTNLSRLDFGHCHGVKQLPEQVGDMKGLKILDASHTAIELLPDSICQLKHLEVLNLEGCIRLRELPEQIGNMEGLRTFDASKSAIGQLPDSFQVLIHLVELNLKFCKNLTTLPSNIWELSSLELLDLNYCSNLDRLPEQLGKMQCLKKLVASGTPIKQLPDSIGQLSRLRTLDLAGCKKLENLPAGIWDLTSIENLDLWESGSLKYLPDCVI